MSLYRRPDSDVWWANIVVPGKPRIRQTTGTTDRAEAQRIHDELKAAAWSTKPETGRYWSDAVKLWLSKASRSDSEILSLAKFGRQFSDRPLSRIHADDLRNALQFCKSAGTYTRYRTMLMAILNTAKHAGWIDAVPNLERRVERPKPREWITHEQWQRLYDELPAHLKPVASFAVATGLRRANVFGLTWSRVDLDRRVVWTEAQDTKAGHALSTPLSDQAIAALEAVKGQHPVWCFTYRGKPITSPKKAFEQACVRAGVPTFTWHGLRHTWATWHIQHGTPLEVLRILGGWSDLRMVTHYAHHAAPFVASYANNSSLKG